MDAQNTAMRLFNRTASAMYKVSRGRVGGSVRGAPVLLLTVRGRKSGEPRTSPACYFEHDGELLVVGSANGSDSEPQWFRNLRAASTAQIQRGTESSEVAVRIATPEERDRLWTEVVTRRSPFFADYAKKTSRTIPIAILTTRI